MLKSEIDVLDVLGGNSIANMTRRRLTKELNAVSQNRYLEH